MAKFKVGDRVKHKLGAQEGIVLHVNEPKEARCKKPCEHCEVEYERRRSEKAGISYQLRVLDNKTGYAKVDRIEEELERA